MPIQFAIDRTRRELQDAIARERTPPVDTCQPRTVAQLRAKRLHAAVYVGGVWYPPCMRSEWLRKRLRALEAAQSNDAVPTRANSFAQVQDSPKGEGGSLASPQCMRRTGRSRRGGSPGP